MKRGIQAPILVSIGMIMGLLLPFGWGALVSQAQTAGCQTFPQTGHKVCGKFLQYWQTHGGLAQQGYPLSEEFTETSQLNGKPYTVQYFERAVFEYHPENQPPNDVLLSQLGTYIARDKYTQGFPATSGEQPFFEDRNSPEGTLKSYYNAVNRKEYERAYRYFDTNSQPQPYNQWAQGYADTKVVTLTVGLNFRIDAGAGNLFAGIPTVIQATRTNGSTSTFYGCYIMHRVNSGISPNPEDVLWRIRSATLTEAPAGASPDSVLPANCAPTP